MKSGREELPSRLLLIGHGYVLLLYVDPRSDFQDIYLADLASELLGGHDDTRSDRQSRVEDLLLLHGHECEIYLCPSQDVTAAHGFCLQFSFVPFQYYFYPETANISLEQIDDIFLQISGGERTSANSHGHHHGQVVQGDSEKAAHGTMEPFEKGTVQLKEAKGDGQS